MNNNVTYNKERDALEIRVSTLPKEKQIAREELKRLDEELIREIFGFFAFSRKGKLKSNI